MSKVRDEDKIPFGKFKGTKMTNIPAWYLLWLWDNREEGNVRKLYQYFERYFKYIERNYDLLLQEKRNQQTH